MDIHVKEKDKIPKTLHRYNSNILPRMGEVLVIGNKNYMITGIGHHIEGEEHLSTLIIVDKYTP